MSGSANETKEVVCSDDSSIVSRHRVGVEATAEDGFDLVASPPLASAGDVSSSVPASCPAPLLANAAALTELNDSTTRHQPTVGSLSIGAEEAKLSVTDPSVIPSTVSVMTSKVPDTDQKFLNPTLAGNGGINDVHPDMKELSNPMAETVHSDETLKTSETGNLVSVKEESKMETVSKGSPEISSKVDSSAVTGESEPGAESSLLHKEEAKAVSEDGGMGKTDGERGASKASASEADEEKQSIYHIKWIKHKSTQMPVITQNENGPCPLLAIMNLLLLQAKIKLPSQAEVVTSNELMAYLADWIFEHVPKNISEDTRLNYEQNMHDAIAVFPKLQTGLDVNVRFTGVSQFEYTPECIVFDLLDVPLYHGWLVDPQMPDLVSAIANLTYNQLVEKIILQKNSNMEAQIAEALLAEEFLNITASQLTYYGLIELSATIKEQEMCVFFRNNHFNTLYKHKNELFVLVTDQGFLRESNVVWETLSNIEGDGHFVDADFRTYRLPDVAVQPLPTSSFPVNSKEQIDHDYLVALSLEQEQSEVQPGVSWPDSATISDHELALRLQEEENQGAEPSSALRQVAPRPPDDAPAAVSTTTSAPASGGSKEKKESNCSLM